MNHASARTQFASMEFAMLLRVVHLKGSSRAALEMAAAGTIWPLILIQFCVLQTQLICKSGIELQDCA